MWRFYHENHASDSAQLNRFGVTVQRHLASVSLMSLQEGSAQAA